MKIQIPENLSFLFKPKRFKIMFGGRGGYKTVSASKALLFLAAREKKRVLCLREYMNSIDDSVHSALKDEIEGLNMTRHFRVTNNQINGVNKSAFRFAGLARNLSSIKSKHDFDIAWIEEAETTTQKSLDVLFPTIRKNNSEIWITFNPEDEFSAVYTLIKPFLDEVRAKGFYEDDTFYIVKTSLEDNPFAPKELLEDSARMKLANPKKWLHIYGGEVYSDYKDSIIQPEWFESAKDAHLKLNFKPMGVKSVGFDLADTGDAKALIHRYGSVITRGSRWHDGELPDAIDRAFAECEEERNEFQVYDDDGLGKSMKVYQANVTLNKRINVIPYNGNGRVDDPEELYTEYEGQPDREKKKNKDMFRNKRAQYYWRLRDRFEATHNAVTRGIYTNPEDLISLSSTMEDLDVLKSELVKVKRVRGNNSFIQIQSKKDAAKEGIKSPNMADALVMCFANPAPKPAPVELNFTSEF